MVTLQDIRAARERLKGVAVHTPLIPYAPSAPDSRLWFKPENLQPIGHLAQPKSQ